MSIWKDNTAAKPPSPLGSGFAEPTRYDPPPKPEPAPAAAPAPVPAPVARTDSSAPRKESLIAADITIEGKIEGGGSVRIAGNFKGDVNVQGDLTIESGAKLTGSVRAANVAIAGELEGNVEEAARVELMPSAVVVGDVKGGSVTVAAGARMRGHTEFGWGDGKGPKPGKVGTVAERSIGS
jgi:cytoskeletal protein CcmA (bactofilin family)